MAGLVARYGEISLSRRPILATAAEWVVRQQVSMKAAQTIFDRLRSTTELRACKLAELSSLEYKKIGLPESKMKALRGLADAAVTGRLDALRGESEEHITQVITALPGVGKWTADMVLIFAYARPDVWPTSDYGLRKAIALLYGSEYRSKLDQIGKRFAPYRSYAAKYLWRSLGNC